jgi:hypothetical protein
MEILIVILLIILLAFDGAIIVFYIKDKGTPKEKPMKVKLSKEDKEKQKRIKESFDNLMKYDEQTARRRK